MKDEKEFLQSLQVGDKVHLYNKHKKDNEPPLYRAVVARVSGENITLLFATGLGEIEYNIGDLTGYHYAPYTEEAEVAHRQREKRIHIASKLVDIAPKQWYSLPTEALDDICAILRENGVNV